MRAALAMLLLLAPCAAFAAQTLVVVTEPLSPSAKEALEGLRSELASPLEVVSAGRSLPPGPHGVIIAIGSHAALKARRAGAPMVVALAPAYRPEQGGPPSSVVAMTPSPERFVASLAALGVRRLLAVRAAPAEPEFARRAAEAGRTYGLAVEDQILSSPDGLAHLLRAAGTRADAVWLAPDPASVTPENFGVVREFARARGIPFFAPAAGLASEEIRGDLTVSFRDCGREAARSAQEMLAGRSVARVVYPAALDVVARPAVSTAAR